MAAVAHAFAIEEVAHVEVAVVDYDDDAALVCYQPKKTTTETMTKSMSCSQMQMALKKMKKL